MTRDGDETKFSSSRSDGDSDRTSAPDGSFSAPIHRISVVVPMFNEAAHVHHLVEDLAAQDFEGEVEAFVADGGSTDGSRDLLEAAAARAGVDVRVLDNPDRYVSPGLNRCLRHARGDLIVRLDCHSRYPRDYLRRCARASEETGAWNVGGVFVIEGRTPMERAIGCALESPFGGHNWIRHSGNRRVEVDTVFCGAFRREALSLVGGYDEAIRVSEDEELNLRLRLAGGSVVFDPSIRPTYIPRGSFRALFTQYYRYGFHKVSVVAKHRRLVSGRSLAPFAFVASLALLIPAARTSKGARRILRGELVLYGASAAAASAISIRQRGESWHLLPRVLVVFPTLHLAHGLGAWHGSLRALARALMRRSGEVRS